MERIPSDIKVLLCTQYLSVRDIVCLARTNHYFYDLLLKDNDVNRRIWLSLYRRDLSEVRLPKDGSYCASYQEIMHDQRTRGDDRYYDDLVMERGCEKFIYARCTRYNGDTDDNGIFNRIGYSLMYGHSDIYNYLMDLCAGYEMQNLQWYAREAARNGHNELVLSYYKHQPEAYDYIMQGAGMSDNVELFKQMPLLGWRNSLIEAIIHGHTRILDYVKVSGNLTQPMINDLLAHAISNDKHKLTEKLISFGVTDYNTGMIEAIRRRDYALVQRLLNLQSNLSTN
jgi:hypothetical protein